MAPPPAYSRIPKQGLGGNKSQGAEERTPLLGSGTKMFIDQYFAIIVAAVVCISIIFGIFLIAHFSYTCEIPENAEVASMSYTFNPEDYREFFFHLDEGITGDIVVTQSRDRIENNVTITITAQGSTPDMLSAIALNTIPNRRTSLVETNIFLNMKPYELRTALSRNCTHVEVDITFPRSLVDYDLIQLESRYGGHVIVRLQDETSTTTTTTVERIEVLTKDGDVSVNQVSITNTLNVVAKRGAVQADVEVGKIVNVQAGKDVVLELESMSSSMDVKVSSSDNAQVTMVDNHTLKGYMSYNRYEPAYLPRIEIEGYTARLALLS
ncbi:hypothetical protein BGZ95_003568 [Linnemannia exigua]|uniref:Adhesin domain-containing protein n=1 Tax=Linnemannia exigua TaxID=604196 RepID=A0AAD4DI90_9FUNG|nr:hypothetical protein BGZ95_003568 [Linnemannia exigua]